MSTGLDCWIEERDDGFYFGIEDPFSNSLDPDYNIEGPFATVEELVQAYSKHANPGGHSVGLKTLSYEEFDRQWQEAYRRWY